MIFDVQKSILSLGGSPWDLEIPPDSLLGQLPIEMFDHLQKFVSLLPFLFSLILSFFLTLPRKGDE